MSESLFARLCVSRYPIITANYPGEGRRKLKLRIADEFWSFSPDNKKAVQDLPPIDPNAAHGFLSDGDPSDEISNHAPGVGIIVRTDYSNESAWAAFHDKLKEAQEELFSATPDMDESSSAQEREEDDDEAMEEEDEEDEKEPPVLFHIINPTSQQDRTFIQTRVTSNLSALRLLNDVSVRKAPLPALGSGIKRIKPPNRLIDHDGWQEIYIGKTIWIYDEKSNQDGCARLVSQQSADSPYGTATGDSWRARASHIPELQINIAAGAITIDFGGTDRWDYNERQRNLQEAIASLP